MLHTTKYKLLAIDVDGTLLDSEHKITPATAAAVAKALSHGMKVMLATGRSYIETIGLWRELFADAPPLPPHVGGEPVVLIGGALVSEAPSGRTLYHRAIDHDVACAFGDALLSAGKSAMAILDPWRHGLDYFIVEGPDCQTVRQRWFSQMNVKSQTVKHLNSQARDFPILRISVLVDPAQGQSLTDSLLADFAGKLNIYPIHAPNYGITIVEAFAPDVNKWTAVSYVAQGARIPASRIVAVGDDINDLPMIENAGLGVAMPKAPANVKAVAKQVAANGLAAFIDELLAGKFE
jgi:Cof subfamily protein (haloacid dehalogenase superfamily)